MTTDHVLHRDEGGNSTQPDVELRRQNLYQWLSRLGYAARGTVYVVIGWLALALAMGWGGGTAGSKDAIRYLAEFEAGGVIATTLLVGLGAFGGWRFFQTLFDPDGHGLGLKGSVVRFGLLLSGIVYVSLALFVARIHFGLDLPWDKGDKSYSEWAALLLSKPAGQWLVGAVCLVALGAAIGHYIKAIRKTFLRYMDIGEDYVMAVTLVSQVGLIARGTILLVIGWYLGRVFVSLNPHHAIDEAGVLQVLHDQPFGFQLLLVAAIGLFAFGLYGLLEAVFRRIDLDT